MGLYPFHLNKTVFGDFFCKRQLGFWITTPFSRKKMEISKYTGVTWHRKDQRWQAAIKVGAKSHYLGQFQSEEEAARAYDKAVRMYRELYTVTRPLNFPEQGEAQAAKKEKRPMMLEVGADKRQRPEPIVTRSHGSGLTERDFRKMEAAEMLLRLREGLTVDETVLAIRFGPKLLNGQIV
jgi:hypothetical protein